MSSADKEFLKEEEREVEVKTEKELLEEAFEKEEDALKKAEIRRRIEEIELEEAENIRVAEEKIKAEKEERKGVARENRARAWGNTKYAARVGGSIAVDTGVASGQGIFIILSGLLYFLDWMVVFNGIDFATFLRSLPSVWQIFRGGLFIAIIITLIILYFIMHPDKREFSSWAVLIIVLYLSIALTAFNPIAYVHLAFAIAVLILYLYPVIPDRATANFAITIMIIIDFFAFSFFAWLGQITQISALGTLKNRLLFPFWTCFLLIFPPGIKKKAFAKVVTLGIAIFYIGLFVVPNFTYMRMGATITKEDIIAYKEAWNVWKINMKNWGLAVWTKGEKGTQKIIAQAAGPYYTGVVDENEEKPLGVYIEDVKGIYPYFYFDDVVSLTAQVNVNALGEPVNVALSCTVKDKNGTVTPDYYPNNELNFDIAESESIPIECKFEPGLFSEGYYKATIRANFNFVTYAYLQKYFIDEATVRNIPIDTLLKGYDKNPVSHSTNGPVMITMTRAEDSPIVPIKGTISTKYRFGFDIQNNWRSQEGVIKDLNDIIILIPDSMNLKEMGTGYDCSHKFIDASVNDCLVGCEESTLCKDICEVAFDGHKGYKLDPEVLKNETRLRDIEDVRTFSCEVEIPIENRARIIGETVPNTLEFRVIAKYDYSALGESSPFEIRLRHGFNVFITPFEDATSSDILVCKGIHTEKNVNEAKYQFFQVVNGQDEPLSDTPEPKSARCDSLTKTCKGEIPKQKRGLFIKCKMTIQGDENEYSSQTIRIKNSPPIVKAYFEPPEPNVSQDLACKGNVTDEDTEDVVEVTYDIESIREANEYIAKFKMPTNFVACPKYTCNGIGCPDYMCSIPIENTAVIAKRFFRCKLVPYDKSGEDNNWGSPDYAFAYVIPPLQTVTPANQAESQPPASGAG